MLSELKTKLLKTLKSRLFVLVLVIMGLLFILVYRLFQLQIVHGEEYLDNFLLTIEKTTEINAPRGKILDRNGELLAYNELSYNVIVEDTYDSGRYKNIRLNNMAHQLITMIESTGSSINSDFNITVDEHDNFVFSVEGSSLLRFKADIYGYRTIEELKAEEKNATPQQIMNLLTSTNRYGIYSNKYDSKAAFEPQPYTEDFKEKADTLDYPDTFSKEELIKIVTIRQAVAANAYQRYRSATIATNVSDETVTAIMENKINLQGVDIQSDYRRVYQDGEYFSQILGYTGKASQTDLDNFAADENNNHVYGSNDIVGKSGIEQAMEAELQGEKGYEKIYVNNVGTVLETAEKEDPQAGKDIYLSIDKNLQIAVYHILEQELAGILYSRIQNVINYDPSQAGDASSIIIPISDVYFTLINNNIVDLNHFGEEDASQAEKSVYEIFARRQEDVFREITNELTADNPKAYRDCTDEMKAYMSYIVNNMLPEQGVLDTSVIDENDETYQAWRTEESISLKEYLTYAIGKNWINISEIAEDTRYLSSDKIYEVLSSYITQHLDETTGFSKLIYKYLIKSGTLGGTNLCQILYDQNILEEDEENYQALASGSKSAYTFLKEKIKNLELTPAQLALDPCTASAVMQNPETGELLACVSYPGYDNNRLSNGMDSAYYRKLSQDLSEPFLNHATQQATAPGSTFKMVSAVAGLEENVINLWEDIDCTGSFDIIKPQVNCWRTYGHGDLDVSDAIANSCNVFFYNVGYRLSLDNNQVYNESKGISALQKYAKMFGLGESTEIEIAETPSTKITTEYPITSAIGQGNHNYTTAQLARYVTTLANHGTCYNLTILDKITDSSGTVLENFLPQVYQELDISSSIWSSIETGMENVIDSHSEIFGDMNEKLKVAGKTGTAQQIRTRGNHSLFVGFASDDLAGLSLAVRIPYGYTSTYAAEAARDIWNYYFQLKDEAELITGQAANTGGVIRD